MGEDFVPGHPQACLFALGSQVRTVLFSSDMGRLWVQSHIGKRSAPLMLYKCLAQAWVYHYYTCSSGRGVPFGVTNSCSRSKSQKLPPKANNTFDRHCPQKHLFVGGFFSNPQAICLLWDQRTHTALFLQVTWAVFETCFHIEERCALLMPYKR